MNPQQIKVRSVPPSMGDYLAIFPNSDLRNRACDICAFHLGDGVQIQLTRWVKNSGMIPDPTTHMARLKVHDLPHQFWTEEDLSDLVSGFGTLERMSDFPQNENYEELRVLVACYHPTHILEDITATQDSSSVAVHFEMEGWLLKTALQTPQNKSTQGDQHRQGEGDDEENYWDKEWKDRYREMNNQQGQSSDSGGSSGPVTQFIRQQQDMQRQATYNPQMENMVMQRTGEGIKSQIQTETGEEIHLG